MTSDILKDIENEDLPKLSELYKKHLPYTSHVYNFINTAIKWKKKCPEKNYLTFMAPDGEWESDGTFIIFMQFSCHDLFVFTLDNNCVRLSRALKETNRINWNLFTLFYACHKNHTASVLKAMEEKSIPIMFESKTDIWWAPKEKVTTYDIQCPDDVYIETLKSCHAETVNHFWPHKYPGSVNYLRTFIEMNGGHGVFLKSNNQLVAWCLKNQMGCLGILQTHDDFKRRGYASLITKSLSKEIGEEGHNPLGTVMIDNEASQAMFTKIGFEILGLVSFIGVGFSNTPLY